jgi:uncharacterized membrane protein
MDDTLLRKLLWATVIIGIVSLLFFAFVMVIWANDWNAFHMHGAMTAQRVIRFAAFLILVVIVLIGAIITVFVREIKKQRSYLLERIRELDAKINKIETVTIKDHVRGIYERIYALEKKE